PADPARGRAPHRNRAAALPDARALDGGIVGYMISIQRKEGRTTMKVSLILACSLFLAGTVAHAQEAVVAAPDTDALFHSPDPKLNANKQAAYMIIKDLLEAGHWERADKYLTERYIQHNP